MAAESGQRVEVRTLGLLSDTHGRMPDTVLEVLEGAYDASRVLQTVPVEATVDDPAPRPVRCDLIAHAGDIGSYSVQSGWILDALEAVAPVVAVLGNNDPAVYATGRGPVGLHAVFELAGARFAMLHEPAELQAATQGRGPTRPAFIKPMPRVLVHGHTHVPKIAEAGGRLTLCPGAVSRPRQGGGPTMMLVRVAEPGRVLTVQLVSLA